MTFLSGTVEYTLGTASVTSCGTSWIGEELDTALTKSDRGPGNETQSCTDEKFFAPTEKSPFNPP